MKKRNTLPLLILTIFTIQLFSSCLFDDAIDIDSCLSFDKVSPINLSAETKVGTSQTIVFEATNDCNINVEVLELDVDTNNNEFAIEGLKKGDIITKNGITFNIIFTPKSTGTKNFKFSIKTIEGNVLFNLGAKGI